MRECPNCKTILEDDELYCHECGAKQEIKEGKNHDEESTSLEKKCIYCGETIESDSVFCPYCGKKLKDNKEVVLDTPHEQVIPLVDNKPQPDVKPHYESDEWKEKPESKKWLPVIVVGCLLVIIGGALLFAITDDRLLSWNKQDISSLTSDKETITADELIDEIEDTMDVDDSEIERYKDCRDLITFDDIIKTNGDFDELVKKHGFEYVEFQLEGSRFPPSYYYKNCIVLDGQVIPTPENGTPVRIDIQGTMTATNYVIEVFSDVAFNKLKTDFLKYVVSQDGENYSFYWADGHISKYDLVLKNQNKEGGCILIAIPYTSWEELEEESEKERQERNEQKEENEL